LKRKTYPIVLSTNDLICDDINVLITEGFFVVKEANIGLSNYLSFINDALTFSIDDNNQILTLSHSFTSGKNKHRQQYGGGKNQPLPKACGLDKHPNWTIFDATAGIGRDAYVLAGLGAQVTLCEQHPVLYALLVDAIKRGALNEEVGTVIQRMQVIHGNSLDVLNNLLETKSKLPDVIYLDPMYPDRKKSAKVKKEMQILQHLVGYNSQDNSLFEAAYATACHRVVVKRPKSAVTLASCKPSYTVKSLNTRYDVYVI
jgi:16S rRNA (guanine1516-N2)-methyltransferase